MPKPKASPRYRNCLVDQKMLREIHQTLHHHETGIARRIRYLTDEISVNGSKGLENVLRDNHTGNIRNAAAIAELKELTNGLKVNRQLRRAWEAWLSSHPVFAKATNTAAKRAGWFIVMSIAGYFGYAELLK